MDSNDIKKLNQDLYTLDTDTTRDHKVIFIAALIF